MALKFLGRRHWEMTRDAESHRDYKVIHRVGYGSTLDGPAVALNTPGLPFPGAYWVIDNDVDYWATCRWDARVTPVVTNEPGRFFDVEQTFSTKQTPGPGRNCKDQQTTNPLLEPMKVSGSFVKYMEEATHDRFGTPILTSSHEQPRGQQVEFDANRLQIKIEQNVAYLGIEIFARMVDHLNAFSLWGMPPRTIKLSNVSWERKFYGRCNLYYTRNFEFDVRFDGFDRWLLDEGTKVLNGHWNRDEHDYVLDNIKGQTPDPRNPTHFKRYVDIDGNMCRVILDGKGMPFIPEDTDGVTGCSACPYGAPSRWRVTGTGIITQADVILEYPGAGCAWQGTSDPLDPFEDAVLVWNLFYVAGSDTWTLQNEEATWYLSNKRFNCTGPNTFTMDQANINQDWPRQLTITAGNLPGEIFIQKYDEADFLLLGIPLLF